MFVRFDVTIVDFKLTDGEEKVECNSVSRALHVAMRWYTDLTSSTQSNLSYRRETKKKAGSGFSIFGKKKVVAKEKKVVGGTHTLHSTGIFSVSKKKNNEYFGGDSTVTQAGERQTDKQTDRRSEREGGRDCNRVKTVFAEGEIYFNLYLYLYLYRCL